MSDSGRVCNAPRSSILFDGVPTLTGLEGDMWASQLLTLYTSTSFASITFDFTNPTDTIGATFYLGVKVIEVVMFNCPAREIGTNSVQVSAQGLVKENIVVSKSCDYLVIGCSTAVSLSPSTQPITLSFSKTYPRLYIAEITFYSSMTHQCSPVCPLNTSVESTSEQTSTSSSNQESTSNKETQPPTLASETSKVVTSYTTKQDFLITLKEKIRLPPTSESILTVVEDKNISVSTDYKPTKSCSSNSNIELAKNEMLSKLILMSS